MRTKSGQQGPRSDLSRSKDSALIAQHSVVSFAFCALLLALNSPAQAQQVKNLPRIGYLSASSLAALASRTEAFRHGLSDLGYVEGKNIVIEYRYGDGQLDRVPALAAELLRLNVNMIVIAGGNATVSGAKQAIESVPIIMANVQDAVGSGFVASLAHPGGNITGLSALTADLAGKRLDLIRETFPRASRVAALFDPQDDSKIAELKEAQAIAKAAGFKLQAIEVRRTSDFERAFKAAAKERAEVLLVLQNALTTTGRRPIADLAIRNRLPTVWADSGLMDTGGLMSYGPNVSDLFRRAATYVDKILKGGKPADLPVEQPKKFEFVINLKTAKQIGLTIPPNVLARADKVIR
jgi:putative ABC transport system substrate-binding protein